MKLDLKKTVNKPYIRVGIQIYLVVMMSIAFSFLIHSSEAGMVSADVVASTCLKNDLGAVCQQYAGEDCGGECSSSACIPSLAEDVAECKPGTCYDPDWGTCSPNSPPQECNDDGGEFYPDPNANVDVCLRGCCQIGSFVNFITQRACEKNGEIRTVPVIFDSDKNAIECLGSQFNQVDGACLNFVGSEKECKFTTGQVCAQSDGEFYEGFLCTNPVLNMGYFKEAGTACFGDDVHWVDDHGNKENVYDANSDTWNNGRVLTTPTCNLDITADRSIINRNTCGNCDYILTSTKCGEKTLDESLPDGDYVCRDLSCVNPLTNEKRLNGESWCYYQSAVEPSAGADDLNRSVTLPGSRHFLMQCRDGVVHNESCGDNRVEVCTEQTFLDDNAIERSLAQCHPNQAQTCINYNTWDDTEAAAKACEDHPECFLKEINVPSSNVEFSVCVPKYPPAATEQQAADNICSLANMECTSAKVVRKFKSNSDINKGCRTPAFIQQMNDLCMSFGDCGASVSYVGTYTDEGVSITGTGAEFSNDYLSGLTNLQNSGDDSIPTVDISQYPNISEDAFNYFNSFSSSEDLGRENSLDNSPYLGGIEAISSVAGSASLFSLFGHLDSGGAVTSRFEGFGPGVFYAIAAATLTMWFINYLGDGGYGLSRAEAEFATTAAIVGGSLLGGSGAVYAAGWWVLLAVALYVWFLGQADVHEYTTTFECHPWSAPIGGDECSKCGQDGFGCSKYACESLGTECEFINEGTRFEECKHNPSDPAPPVINPLYSEDIPSEGYEYVKGGNVYEIKKTSGDGCIPAYELVKIGLALNEPGRCTIKMPKSAFDSNLALTALDEGEFDPADYGIDFFGLGVSPEHSLDDFSDSELAGEATGLSSQTIELYFGGNSRFLMNHTHPIYIPSLSDLGGTEFDPNERMELNLDVFCEDTAGHSTIAPYRIQMCIAPQDRTGIPPIPFYHTPRNGKMISDVTDAPISIYNNVPAKCKWDTDQTLSYSEMQNDMLCEINSNSF